MAQCYGCTASTTRTWARGHDGLHRNEVMRRHYGTVEEKAIQRPGPQQLHGAGP